MSSGEQVPGNAPGGNVPGGVGPLDVERDSDVPISTQIFWQIAYQIDSGRLLPGARLAPVRELGAALRVNPNTIRAAHAG
jgi:DNA-binding transcriptional regulator YhcF (GntR family)